MERRAPRRRSIRSVRAASGIAVVFAGDLFFWHLAILGTTVANATFLATTAPIWVAFGAWLLALGADRHAHASRPRALPRRRRGACSDRATALRRSAAGRPYGLVTAVFFGSYVLAVRAARRRHGRRRSSLPVDRRHGGLPVRRSRSARTAAAAAIGERLAALVALALVSQVGGQGLVAIALGTLPATFSSLVIFIEAIAAAAFGWLILGEALGPVQVARRRADPLRHLGGAAAQRRRLRRGRSHERARAFLEHLFRTAVAAAHPAACLPAHLPRRRQRGRLIILAAGKAAGSMTEVAERHYLDAGCNCPQTHIDRPRGDAPRLCAADRAHPGDRSRASGAGPGRARCRRANAGARRCAPAPTISCWC